MKVKCAKCGKEFNKVVLHPAVKYCSSKCAEADK